MFFNGVMGYGVVGLLGWWIRAGNTGDAAVAAVVYDVFGPDGIISCIYGRKDEVMKTKLFTLC